MEEVEEEEDEEGFLGMLGRGVFARVAALTVARRGRMATCCGSVLAIGDDSSLVVGILRSYSRIIRLYGESWLVLGILRSCDGIIGSYCRDSSALFAARTLSLLVQATAAVVVLVVVKWS